MMRLWTVAIGTRGCDLVNNFTGSREFPGHRQFMARAEVAARNPQEVVVTGDDAAHLVLIQELSDATNSTLGSASARAGRLGRSRQVPRFSA
jgi:hypothetical protein